MGKSIPMRVSRDIQSCRLVEQHPGCGQMTETEQHISIIESVSFLLAVFCIHSLFTLICPSLLFATAGTDQDQIRIIESHLFKERQKFEQFDFQEKDMLRQVSLLEGDIADQKRAINLLKKKVRAARTEIGKMEKRQARLERQLAETEARAGRRLIALYKYARKGCLRILANTVGLEQLRQRFVYLRAVSNEDTKELSRLAAESRRYRSEIVEIKEQIYRKEAALKKEKADLIALRKDLEEKVVQLMRIHREKEFYETAVRELQRAAQDLKQTFAEIEETRSGYRSIWSARFADSRRKLPFPLKGRVIRGDTLFGKMNSSLSKGIFIEGSDTEVRAVFPGRVDFSGRMKGYGEIVIINHGDRFFSVSAQLFRRLKKEGDLVNCGDVIGLVSRNAKTNKTRLYFEIRRGGKSLDPLAWLRVE